MIIMDLVHTFGGRRLNAMQKAFAIILAGKKTSQRIVSIKLIRWGLSSNICTLVKPIISRVVCNTFDVIPH